MDRNGPHCPTATLLARKNADVHGTGACWVPEAVRTFWCRDKSVVLVGIRTHDHPARSLGTVPTELTRILGKAKRSRLKDKKFAAIIATSCVCAKIQLQTKWLRTCQWNCTQGGIRCAYGQLHAYTRGSPDDIQTRSAAARPIRHLCYCPAVLYRNVIPAR